MTEFMPEPGRRLLDIRKLSVTFGGLHALRDLDLADVQAGGYVFQVEMTYRLVRAGRSVVEVPISFSGFSSAARGTGNARRHVASAKTARQLLTPLPCRPSFLCPYS